MCAGPMRIDVIEPLRRTRVVLDDNDSGIGCELEFSARTGAIQEGRQTLWQGARRFMDATRFDQFGVWSGTVRTPEGDINVDPAACRATKDRSWGVRPVGQPEPAGAPVVPAGIFFLWAPLFWEDHVSHAIFFDGPRGEPLFREALTAPLFASEDAVPNAGDAAVEPMASATHRVAYHANSRLAIHAEIDLHELAGERREISLTPMLRFQMKGLGYGHPEWRHGLWHDQLTFGHESFDPAEVNLVALENVHVQQVVRARDGNREGIGVLEQVAIGPYAPAGFKSYFGGAET